MPSRTAVFRSCKNSFGYEGTSGLGGIVPHAPEDGPSRHRVGGSVQIIPVVGRKKQSPSTHCIQYTEADIRNLLASALKPACCTSAFEGAAVMADQLRSARCVRTYPDAPEASPRKFCSAFRLLEREGQLRTFHVATVSSKTLGPIIEKQVSRESNAQEQSLAGRPISDPPHADPCQRACRSPGRLRHLLSSPWRWQKFPSKLPVSMHRSYARITMTALIAVVITVTAKAMAAFETPKPREQLFAVHEAAWLAGRSPMTKPKIDDTIAMTHKRVVFIVPFTFKKYCGHNRR